MGSNSTTESGELSWWRKRKSPEQRLIPGFARCGLFDTNRGGDCVLANGQPKLLADWRILPRSIILVPVETALRTSGYRRVKRRPSRFAPELIVNFAYFEFYLSVGLLCSSMIGMGATLRPREFKSVFRSPWGVAAVLLAQIVVTPLLALGLSSALGLAPGIAFGLLLMAALPGGSFSNLLTFLGRGNVALSIVATAVSTLFSLATTSFLLGIYGSQHLPKNFRMPVGQIVLEIGCYLLIPLALGMLLRRLWPQAAPRLSRVCIQVSTVLLMIFVAGALSSGRLQVLSYGWRAPLAMILFGVCSMWTGVGTAMLFRLSPNDRFTVAIEVVVRNGNLGLLLKAALLPAVAGQSNAVGDGVLFVVLFYSGLSLLLGGLEVILKRLQMGVLYAPPRPGKKPA